MQLKIFVNILKEYTFRLRKLTHQIYLKRTQRHVFKSIHHSTVLISKDWK